MNAPSHAARGFILQASYRVVHGPNGRRVPVVHLYGRLEQGGTFLVRDDRQRPHFFIEAADADRARALGAPAPEPTDRRTFDGAEVAVLQVEVPPDVPPLRDRLHEAGIDTFEADVRFAARYLIERGIKGGCEIEGDGSLPAPAASPGFSTTRCCAPRDVTSRAAGPCHSTSRRTQRASACWQSRCSPPASTKF